MSTPVAVFQIGSLGDSIVSVPALLSIRELIPECSEYILVSRFDSTLKVIPSDIFDMAWKPKLKLQYAPSSGPFQQLLTIPTVLAKLRYYHPRYCVSLMPADREPERIERDKRFFKAAGVRELFGFHALPRSTFEPSSVTTIEGTEAYQRFQRIWGDAAAGKFAKYASMPILHPPVEAIQRVGEWLKAHRKYPNRRLVAISPYSNFSSRDVPEDTIVKVLEQLEKRDVETAIVGGGKDSERAARAIAGASAGLNTCGEFSVQESAALLKASNLAICTESGPMHLASAVGAPLLATFSRINPQLARWLPFNQRSKILYREVPCAGCFSFDCPVEGHPCMTKIASEHIVNAALNMLNGLPVVQNSLNGTRVLNW